MAERDTLDLRALAVGAGVVAAGIAIAVGAPWLFIAHAAAPANAPNDAVKPAMQEPRQETAPLADIAAYRIEKAKLLEASGVDTASGKRRIPIERAMEIVAARGARASP